MSEKMGGALFALIFMVCFGGVGVFAGGAMGSALWEGFVAQDWIRVKAQITRYDSNGVQYRYRIGDKDYTSDKMGVGWLQSSEVDDELHARLTAARDEDKPLTVFVNPDDPSKSLVDPQIPWTMMAFMTPFAFGFGGVGLGALYFLFHILSGGESKKKAAGRKGIKSSAGSEALGIWVFTFFWNVISFPIAIVAVPDLWRSGEWVGLFVLIFPAIGVLLLWGAIHATIRMIRRGPAQLVLASEELRMGLPVTGHIAFSRGVKRGDSFRAKLSAHLKRENISNPVQVWSKDANVQAIDALDGTRVNFRFDVPSRLPTRAVDVEDYEDLAWRLGLYLPRATQDAAFSFGLKLAPAPDLADQEAPVGEMTLEEMGPAGAAPLMAGIAAIVGKERMDKLSPKDKAQFQAKMAELSPQQREQVAKLVKAGPLIKKLIIAAVVLIVVVQIVAALIALGFSR